MEARTRRVIRSVHADLLAACERAEKVTRPDGTDDQGHPGIQAANLKGVLGGYTMTLLDALERMEAAFEEATVLDVHVAGVPASLACYAAVTIKGLPGGAVSLPLKIGGAAPDGIALILDPRPAMDALMEMRDEMRATDEPESAGKAELSELHEGCARRGGVCDCGTRPCALDAPEPPPSSPRRAA